MLRKSGSVLVIIAVSLCLFAVYVMAVTQSVQTIPRRELRHDLREANATYARDQTIVSDGTLSEQYVSIAVLVFGERAYTDRLLFAVDGVGSAVLPRLHLTGLNGKPYTTEYWLFISRDKLEIMETLPVELQFREAHVRADLDVPDVESASRLSLLVEYDDGGLAITDFGRIGFSGTGVEEIEPEILSAFSDPVGARTSEWKEITGVATNLLSERYVKVDIIVESGKDHDGRLMFAIDGVGTSTERRTHRYQDHMEFFVTSYWAMMSRERLTNGEGWKAEFVYDGRVCSTELPVPDLDDSNQANIQLKDRAPELTVGRFGRWGYL